MSAESPKREEGKTLAMDDVAEENGDGKVAKTTEKCGKSEKRMETGKKATPFIVLKLINVVDMWTQVFVIGKTREHVLNYARSEPKFKGWIREIMSPREFHDLDEVQSAMKILGYVPVMLL